METGEEPVFLVKIKFLSGNVLPGLKSCAMKRRILFSGILCAALIAGCKGYLDVSGNVDEGNEPLKGATVKVVSKKGGPLGSTKTDTAGHYQVGKSTSPMKGSYYVIFEKRGYRTDTVIVQKGRGLSAVSCDHSMEKKEK